MRNLIFTICFIAFTTSAFTQVGINTDNSAPDPSAMLDVQSIDKGMLVPRMSSAQRTIISNAATGLLVFDLDTETFWFYDDNGWTELISGNVNTLTDDDNDTKIQVEKNTDEDVIRFDVAGTESLTISKNPNGITLVHLPSSGANSTVYGAETAWNLSGQYNSIFGKYAGMDLTTGTSNSLVGTFAGTKISVGSRNSIFGRSAGSEITTGNANSIFGYLSGDELTTGSLNAMIGTEAGRFNIVGNRNTMVGIRSGHISEGSGNIYIGYESGYFEKTDDKLYIENSRDSFPLIYGEFDNDLVRVNGDLEVTGDFPVNTILADEDNDTKIQVEESVDEDIIRFDISGEERFSISKNVNGVTLVQLPTDSTYNTIFGHDAGLNVSGYDNSFFGRLTGISTSTGARNTFVGSQTGVYNSTGSRNSMVGFASGFDMTTGNGNSFFGAFTGFDNQAGSRNVLVGSFAGAYNVTGNDNTMLGVGAGENSQGSRNIFIGSFAGQNEISNDKLYIQNSNSTDPLIYGEFDNDLLKINGDLEVTGDFPVSTIVADADNDTKIQVEESGDEDIIRFDLANSEILRLSKNANGITLVELPSSGANSTLYGQHAGENLSTGQNNTFIGKNAGQNLTTGEANTFLGRSSGFNTIEGSNNTFLGRASGSNNFEGSNNTFLGSSAGGSSNGNSNIFIGQAAGFNETGNSRLYIHPDASSTPLIYGEFDNQLLRINGDLEVTGDFPGSDSQSLSYDDDAQSISISGGNTLDLSQLAVPVGTMMMWPTATPPDGWLICDGTAIPSNYIALIALVGNNTPDLVGRFALGSGERNEGSNHPLLSSGGIEDVKLEEEHIPAHTHDVTIGYREGAENGQGQDYSDLGAPTDDHNGSRTYGSDSWGGASNGLTLPHENMPPFFTINYIIKAK